MTKFSHSVDAKHTQEAGHLSLNTSGGLWSSKDLSGTESVLEKRKINAVRVLYKIVFQWIDTLI